MNWANSFRGSADGDGGAPFGSGSVNKQLFGLGDKALGIGAGLTGYTLGIGLSPGCERESSTKPPSKNTSHNRGCLNRFLSRFTRPISKSRQMYPLSVLFGLGFDTATEFALLVIAGTSAAAGLPWYEVEYPGRGSGWDLSN